MNAKSCTPTIDLVAVDLAAGVDQRVALVGRGARGLEPVGVALGIAELERILAHFGAGRISYCAGVEQLLEALASGRSGHGGRSAGRRSNCLPTP